jgi:hypothetical protein
MDEVADRTRHVELWVQPTAHVDELGHARLANITSRSEFPGLLDRIQWAMNWSQLSNCFVYEIIRNVLL